MVQQSSNVLVYGVIDYTRGSPVIGVCLLWACHVQLRSSVPMMVLHGILVCLPIFCSNVSCRSFWNLRRIRCTVSGQLGSVVLSSCP